VITAGTSPTQPDPATASAMKTTPLQSALFAAACILLGGCTTAYDVQVDAISKATPNTPAPQSYNIKSSNPKMDEESLRYKEVADYVKTALSGKGMYEAPNPEQADVVVNLDYGMNSPRVKFETVTTPIIMPVGGGTRTVQVPIRDSSGRIIGYQTMIIQDPPRMEVVGYEDTVRPVIVYEKYLQISARLNKEATEGRAAPEVWSVSISSEDTSKDLRKYLPILASASADYIGTNTNAQKSVKIREGDEVVSFIKKGL